MLLSLAIWLQNTALLHWIRDSSYGYATMLSLHVAFFSLFSSLMVVTDLRLLGWAFRGVAITEIIDQLRVPKRIGLLFAATFGFLVFGIKAEEYYYNALFRTKLALFALVAVHALIFRPRVYNNSNPRASVGRLAAGLSLLLWLSIVAAGRGIGYIHAPVNSHHFR
jgi:hypothetical protein